MVGKTLEQALMEVREEEVTQQIATETVSPLRDHFLTLRVLDVLSMFFADAQDGYVTRNEEEARKVRKLEKEEQQRFEAKVRSKALLALKTFFVLTWEFFAL